jgi:hypothetical protein
MPPFRHLMTLPREQEGGAGGGAAPDAGKPSAADGAKDAGADAKANAGKAEAGGIFDAVDGPAKDANGKPARPEWLAEPFWDADKGEPMVEALAKSQADLRKQIARGDHKPPEKPDAYVLPKIEGVPEIPATDPLWSKVRDAAHKQGVSQAQLDGLVKPYLEFMKGKMPAPADAEAEKAARAAAIAEELGKLGPQGKAVAADIKGWIKGMEGTGSLTSEEAGALLSVGNAAGVRALAKLRALAGGEQSIPVTIMDGNDATQADAAAMMQKGYETGDQALVAKGRGVLQKLEKEGRLKPAR